MTAYTQQLGFDVVTAPLAQIDRRTLSQAWYSALHVVRVSAQESAPARVAPRSTSAPAARHADVENASAPRRPVRATARTGDLPAAVPAAAGERRAVLSALARKIERALVQRRVDAGSASFSLSSGDGRVRVVMRVHAGRTHVVAFCTPEHRDRVERALAQARFALAARGIPMNDRVVESAQ